VKRAIQNGSRATLAGLLVHYLFFYAVGSPLWTDTIAQWIMARTPSQYALWLLGNLGPWAKPFAMTGGLAVLGGAVTAIALTRRLWIMLPATIAASFAFGRFFDYSSLAGEASFWLPAVGALMWWGRVENFGGQRLRSGAGPRPARGFHAILWPCRGHGDRLSARAGLSVPQPSGMSRREALVMSAGTLAVAAESYIRDQRAARFAATPTDLARFNPPPETFSPSLVRKAITPVREFYGMSKNTVDPALDPHGWRLKITVDGRAVREIAYADLLAMPRVSQYSTLRCVSNTLKSDLMGTALWTGVRLRQLIDPASLPSGVVEAAIIGVDGHGDSLPPDFAFSDGTLLALGMNGNTLDRTHGFPLRLVVPRYYGFKNVKWIGEIAFVGAPYFGTWPKLGYTKEPVVHTGSHIDRVLREGSALRIGGVAFAGDRGIRAVQVRAGGGPWIDAQLDEPLSPLCWRRWVASIPAAGVKQVQARAMDGTGAWQRDAETPLFPDGVQGPTLRSVS
jgi:DMSO/TMAO reductase YedYZ molybdopterin-dependent catalytic subunit